jgi:5-methylcytosine-specific restriction enzyme subunit McrC
MTLLYENQNIPDKLALHVKSDKTLYSYFKMEFDGIKPDNYCGFLHVDNQDYFIAPKISKEDDKNLDIFIYMLMYAYDIKLSNEDLANFANTKYRFFEIFIRYFSDKLLDEFKKGVFKKYITLEENLKVLRGKYIIDKNFTNFYHQNIYCEHDEFSMDNELNRFFLYAIKTFKKFSNYQNLSRCEMLLDEVDFLHVEINRLHVNFDKMNSRYKQSYELALMLLKKLIPLTSKNDKQSFVFLFKMSEVFEQFIGKIYQDIDSTTKLQNEKNFGNLKLKPDIVTKNMIIDTKYKKVNSKDDLSTNDKYQMFAYGTNFEIKNTMFLYPKDLLYVEEDLKLGEDDKMIKLKMKTVDLNSDKEFDEYVEKIKSRLENM